MIARVAPLTRLPKGLASFDYTVPPDLENKIQPGHLVSIPFRAATLVGIVVSFVNKTTLTYDPARLKSIISLVGKEPLLHSAHLTYATTVASLYGVSLGTITKIMAPPLQKRKIQAITLSPFLSDIPQPIISPKTHYSNYHTREEHVAAVLSSLAVSGQTLIVLPELHDIADLLEMLPQELQEETTVWHSELSIKEQFERCLKIRNNEKKIIIGLRGSVFLPFYHLTSVIVDYEHHEQHKHWDQAPRFHDIDAVSLLRAYYGCAVHLMSFSPSVAAVHTHSLLPSLTPLPSLPTITDMRAEHQTSHLAFALEEKIQQAQEDIFILINRRGFSRHIACRDCGNTSICPKCQLPLIYHEDTRALSCHYCTYHTAVPLTCARCGSTNIRQHGVGTQFVESAIRKLLPQETNHTLIRVDSDAQLTSLETTTGPRIIVGTEMALSHVRWEKTELVALLDIDQQLALPEYAMEEHVWHLLHEIGFYKMPTAAWYIQTMNPEREILQELTQPQRFYERTMRLRHQFQYPPFTYLVRYFFGGQSDIETRKEARRLHERLSILTDTKKTVTLSDPFEMHPRFFRGRFWYGILARFDQHSWQEDLIWFNTHIPPEWKIDPNPISVLSP